MKGLLKRIQKSVADAYDPDRETRMQALANRIFEGLRTQREAFNVQQVISQSDVSKTDVQRAKTAAFRRLLDNVWKDGVVSRSEYETIKWVERCLELSDEDSLAIQKEYAVEQFRCSLARAMEDGVLDDDEFQHLSHIASTVGSNAPTFAREFFRTEGEQFLHAMFLAAIDDGSLSTAAWLRLLATGNRFGIADSELARIVQLPARQLIEHVLADAKSDGQLTLEEREEINWLLRTLRLDEAYCRYVRQELDEFELHCEIAAGRLPSFAAPAGLELRSGEIVHAVADVSLIITRMLKSGPRQDVHYGKLAVLDSRAVFWGDTKSQSINYRKIIGLRGNSGLIELQLNGKPVWKLQARRQNAFFLPIFRKAVALANQTATRKSDGSPSRHIARDVRQRVWQRYGGRCVECNANDYLEFDHIIPVAKGGSNSEGNIQLLCRRCNLKKSSLI